MFKNLKNRMKKRGKEIIELKKIMTATLESDEHQHRDMIKVLYLITQEQAEVIEKLDGMSQSTESHNEVIKNLVQKNDDRDEKIKFLVQDNKELERRVKNFAFVSNKKFAFVEEIKKIKAEYQKRIDDLTNRLVEKEETIMPKEEYKNLSEQKQQELITDKKKLKELEKLKSKKAEPSDYLMELSKITGSLEIIVEKIFFENPDLTEKQAIILLRRVKSPVDNKKRWRATTIRDRVGNYLKKQSEILRVKLYHSTLIGDTPLNKESRETSATAEKPAETALEITTIRPADEQRISVEEKIENEEKRKFSNWLGGELDELYKQPSLLKAEKPAEEKNVLARTDLGKETLEKKDDILGAKGHPRKGMLLAVVNKDISIREPLWNDMQDSIMDGKWRAFSDADKIIMMHRRRQLTRRSIWIIRRAYFKFARDEEYHAARGGRDYLFERMMRDGVNRFRFTLVKPPESGKDKAEKPAEEKNVLAHTDLGKETLEKKDELSEVEEHPLRRGMLLAVMNKAVSIREPFWNDMQNSIMDGEWHTYLEANIIIRKHGHRPLSMERISHIRQAYFKFARDEEYHAARDGKDYLFELKKTGGVNRFRFTPAGKEAKPDERGETTTPKRKYKKKWNEKLLGKKVYNDIVKWIEKNTCHKNIIFFNNVIVKISQELNKKKGKIYNPGQMHKFIADMLKTFPDKAVNPSQHRINAYRLYFERDGHITYKDWMYTINNDNLVPKQKKENETVEEKIVKDKHADISFIDRLGM